MTEEIWKPVKGFESLYLISNLGRVLSLPRVDKLGRAKNGFFITAKHHSNGYCFTALAKDGECKQFSIHRLVAEAFVPNPYDLPEVNHIDGDKDNNSAENLEWCTRADNNRHAIKFGLRDLTYMQSQARLANMRAVKQIKDGEVVAVYPSMTAAGKAVGTNGGCISQAVRKGTKSGGYEWQLA